VWWVLSLHDLEQLLDNVSQSLLVVENIDWSSSIFGGIIFPISLILDFFVLQFSDFLDFVVVDDELFVVNGLSTEGLFGLGTSIWLFKADKSKGVVLESSFNLDFFNGSVFLEKSLELFLSP
jgi:hypothetical protein